MNYLNEIDYININSQFHQDKILEAMRFSTSSSSSLSPNANNACNPRNETIDRTSK